ncbi:MAG: selenocysteine-specific translation elongation factor [Acetobacteraceae bacterium]
MIVAMAGHVDHGKTSLIRALTGIDTDRLPDEKARGMTIDLGFAHATLPGGTTVGFVDVPGHERFLGNMLAGVLSIESVLLVVAADDGPMPQTHEHLSILRLTGVDRLHAVLTKIDRVGADRAEAAGNEVRQVLHRAGYADAAILPVSSHSGEGIPALRALLAEQAIAWQRPPADRGFRLAIDRAFVVAGAGLVLTGTVASGQVSVGDRLLISPSRLVARVRGIQVHHAPAEVARAGDRCALAVAGPHLERARLRRGDWLVDPALHAPTTRLDVVLRTTEDRPLRHARRMHAHLGSAAIGAKTLVLGGEDLPPNQEGFVNLSLDRPTAALFGDRVVLRDDSSGRVVAGGRVIDPFPPARRVRRERRLAALMAMAQPDPRDALGDLLAAEGWLDPAHFALARNLRTETVAGWSEGLQAIRIGRPSQPVLLTTETSEAIAQALLRGLQDWHERHPDLGGPSKAAVVGFAPAYPAGVTEAVLRDLLADDRLVQQDAIFRLPTHSPVLAEADQRLWPRVEQAMEEAGARSLRVRELATMLELPPAETEALLVRLERFGLLFRVASNRFFLPAAVVSLGHVAADLAREHDGGGFTAAMFNQRSGIGRNLSIEVLEFLDRLGVTQRSGELRHLQRPVEDAIG